MNAPFVASLTLELPLLLFHVSVVACLLQRRQKGDPVFCSDFFTFYLLQSHADIGEYVLMLVHIRLPRIGYMLTPTYGYFAGSVVPFVLVYGMYLQAVVHAAIAVNRYLVLSSTTLTTAADSSERRTRLVVVLLVLLPVPGAALRLLGNSKRMPTGIPGVYAIVRDLPWLFATTQVVSALYCISSSCVSIYFEVRTVIAYHLLSAKAKTDSRNEFLLLVYTLMQFVGQFVVAVYFCVMTYAAFIEDHTLVALAQSMNGVLSDFFCLSAPICLFSTSKLLRRAYKEMYGTWLRCHLSSGNDAMVVDDSPISSFT